MKKVVVLGAGIAGLAAAWFLKKKYQQQIDLTVIEKEGRVGGWIRTQQKAGFLFEEGPRGFRPSGKGKATLELVHALGLDKELVGSNQRARKRYIWHKCKLRPFGLPFLLRQGLVGAVLHDLKTPPTQADDETIYDFTVRRFNQRFADYLMDPLTKGIFGGNIHELSMKSCFPFLWNFEQQKGSVIRGFFGHKKEKTPVALYTLKGGMETLTQTLAQKLECPILLSTTVHSLDEIEADYIISALPTSSLAKLIGQEDPLTHSSLVTVNCGWNRNVLNQRGYGFLVPTQEKGDILGMTWDSEIFPELNQPGETRICVMYPEGEDLYDSTLKNLRLYLGISTPPDVYSIHTAHNAIPQYTLHYQKRMEAFRKLLPVHVYAMGNCFDGVGINDCIFNAQRCVSGAASFLS